jgi:drug/metabolite transporter (DMT)-like permease
MALLMLDGKERQIPVMDLALAVTVPLCYALTNTVIRRWLAHVPSLELSFVSLTAAGVLLVPLSLVVPFERGTATSDERSLAIGSLVFLGIVGTGISTFLFNRLIQHHGPLFAAMVTNLVPIGALLWGWADHEQVSVLQLAALAGLVTMVSVVQFGAARPTFIDETR